MQRVAILSAFVVLAWVVLVVPSSGNEKVSFENKTIKLIAPTTVGGSTDIAARLMARFFAKYLPGNPTVVVQNMPGGAGVPPLNFFAQQVKPDGLTMLLSSNSEADPMTFRKPQASYDPSRLEIIGGIGYGNNVVVIRTEAIPRLLDKSQPPVLFGAVAGAPRGAMRMNIWGPLFLGWNTKWVSGYPGSADLVLAMQRGEVEMTTFPDYYLHNRLSDLTKYKVIYIDGLNPNARPSGRPDIDNAPKFIDAMKDKINDPKILAAFDYWRGTSTFKWMALPPGTPKEIRDVYREAYIKIAPDPEFREQAAKVMESYVLLTPEEMSRRIQELAATSDEAVKTMESLLPKK